MRLPGPTKALLSANKVTTMRHCGHSIMPSSSIRNALKPGPAKPSPSSRSVAQQKPMLSLPGPKNWDLRANSSNVKLHNLHLHPPSLAHACARGHGRAGDEECPLPRPHLALGLGEQCSMKTGTKTAPRRQAGSGENTPKAEFVRLTSLEVIVWQISFQGKCCRCHPSAGKGRIFSCSPEWKS